LHVCNLHVCIYRLFSLIKKRLHVCNLHAFSPWTLSSDTLPGHSPWTLSSDTFLRHFPWIVSFLTQKSICFWCITQTPNLCKPVVGVGLRANGLVRPCEGISYPIEAAPPAPIIRYFRITKGLINGSIGSFMARYYSLFFDSFQNLIYKLPLYTFLIHKFYLWIAHP